MSHRICPALRHTEEDGFLAARGANVWSRSETAFDHTDGLPAAASFSTFCGYLSHQKETTALHSAEASPSTLVIETQNKLVSQESVSSDIFISSERRRSSDDYQSVMWS